MAGDSDSVSGACVTLRARLASPSARRRVGQALWMMTGESVSQPELVWARGALGLGAEVLLWNALCEAGCIAADGQLRVRELSRFLCYLSDEEREKPTTGLVWTFPPHLLTVPGVTGDGYARALQEVVASSIRTLTIASPYLEAKGVGIVEQAALEALQRGVAVVLLTHEADDLGSMASAALHSLQSEARNVPGKLSVYTTSSQGILLHLKVVVADGRRGLVGSANITGKGLGNNLEAGALVGPDEAAEICQVVDRVIAAGLAKHVFSTK